MTTATAPQVHIRWLVRRDLREVLDIESACFPDPWEEEHFIRWLRRRTCIGMIAERDDRVAGFMLYELHKTRLELVKFAVAPNSQRRGVGSQMIANLVGKLSTQRRSRITVLVPETSLGAQLFFKACGFRAGAIIEDEKGTGYQFHYRMNEAAHV